MKEMIEHWKEGAGVLLYFGFLAFFTPKAEALGWGYQGILLCVLAGALLIGLLYLVVRAIADYIADHRSEISEFKEYMGIGSAQPSIEAGNLSESDGYTDAEIEAMLASNPYASAEIFDDDRQTHLLASVDGEQEEGAAPAAETTPVSIIGENPRRRLLLAPNFQPDANALLSTGVAAFGCPGSGKTTVLVRFLEQYIERFHLPCVIFDSQGDFKSLVEDDFCPRGIIATPENMPRMADVVKYGLQVVVDLSEWHDEGLVEMSYELAGRMMARSIRELMAVQRAIEPGKRVSCLVGIDEIHLWVPQNPPSYLQPSTAKSLLDTVIALATTGRKLGVVPFTATPRIAKVNKDVIGSVETRVFGKVDLDNDLKRYREYIPESVASDDQIRAFHKGEMIVCTNGQRLHVEFLNRQTRHVSHTPHITQGLDRFAGRLPAEVLAYITRPVEKVTAPDQREIPVYRPPERKTSGDLVAVAPSPTPARVGTPVRRVSLDNNPELKRAYELYQQGLTTSRPLGQAMGCTHTTANNYLQKLKLLGYIN